MSRPLDAESLGALLAVIEQLARSPVYPIPGGVLMKVQTDVLVELHHIMEVILKHFIDAREE